jgi:hypothetical protein
VRKGCLDRGWAWCLFGFELNLWGLCLWSRWDTVRAMEVERWWGLRNGFVFLVWLDGLGRLQDGRLGQDVAYRGLSILVLCGDDGPLPPVNAQRLFSSKKQ